MGRSRLLVILAGVMLAVLCLPAAASAGSFSWNLPADFTAAAPGANPDHDAYGARPWSYLDGAVALLGAPSFSRLPTFRTATRGGLAGWSQDTSRSDELIAANPSSTALSDGVDSFPAGQLVMTPSLGREVAVAWTSPMAETAAVVITGSISPADPNNCPSHFSWRLDDQTGSSLQSGGASASGISTLTTVDPGGTIRLRVRPPALPDIECDTALLSLHISGAQNQAPQVSLVSPANGALISGGQPTFAGSAATSFGASSTVVVRIYQGSSPVGTPVQTLTTLSSAGSYKVEPTSALPDGPYTAQAEQDDLGTPPGAGLSSPTTFTVHNSPPTITVDSLGRKPLTRSTPTVSGRAGPSHPINLVIYPGADTDATPLRITPGSVDSSGRFSIPITPALADGRYTLVATQVSAVEAALSNPLTFRIKAHAPVVSLTRPAGGSSTARSSLLFSGSAGSSLGDSSIVTMLLYAGSRASGKAVGITRSRVNGGTWTARLTFRPKLGLYTAVAKQSDDAGHVGVSQSDTFRVVSSPTVIGSTVSLTADGTASVPISCPAAAARACGGDVLILTEQRLRPLRGGPSGVVRLLFAYVSIPAGETELISRPLPGDVSRALRRLTSIRVRVLANLIGAPQSTAVRTLHFSR